MIRVSWIFCIVVIVIFCTAGFLLLKILHMKQQEYPVTKIVSRVHEAKSAGLKIVESSGHHWLAFYSDKYKQVLIRKCEASSGFIYSCHEINNRVFVIQYEPSYVFASDTNNKLLEYNNKFDYRPYSENIAIIYNGKLVANNVTTANLTYTMEVYTLPISDGEIIFRSLYLFDKQNKRITRRDLQSFLCYSNGIRGVLMKKDYFFFLNNDGTCTYRGSKVAYRVPLKFIKQ